MENISMESKKMAYLLLQHEYLKMLNLDKLSEKEILNKSNEIFPIDWFLIYTIDDQIKYISEAIKNNKNLIEILDNN